MRGTAFFCLLLGFVWGLGAGRAAAQQADQAERRRVTVGEVTGYVMPPDVARALGLPVEDVPAEENAATLYIQAINALPSYDRQDEEISTAYDAALKGPWSLTDSAFSAWFRSTEEARGLVRQAAAMERCRFPVMGEEPGDTFLAALRMPHLAAMRNLGRLLVIEGHLLEQEGRIGEALDDYVAVIRLGHHSMEDPFLISGLVGLALQGIGTSALADCLARHEPDGGVLAGLAKELDGLGPSPRDRAAWIPGERAMALQFTRMSPADWGLMRGRALPLGEAMRAFVSSRAFRIVWPDRTISADFNGFYDKLEAFAKMPPWDAADALDGFDPRPLFREWNVLALMLVPAVTRALQEYTRGEARHDLLVVDVALRRFRAARGAYPGALDQLVPAYLEELPPDPFTGEPLRYRVEGDGWVLYSVGPNREDDGGAEVDRQEGDIVFRSEAGDA